MNMLLKSMTGSHGRGSCGAVPVSGHGLETYKNNRRTTVGSAAYIPSNTLHKLHMRRCYKSIEGYDRPPERKGG